MPSSRCWMEQPPLQRHLQTRLPAAPCVGHRRPCSRSHRLARGCCLRAKSQPRDRDGSPAITPRSLPPVQRGGAVTPAQPLANSMPEVITAARDSSHLEYCRTPPSGRVLPCSRIPTTHCGDGSLPQDSSWLPLRHRYTPVRSVIRVTLGYRTARGPKESITVDFISRHHCTNIARG